MRKLSAEHEFSKIVPLRRIEEYRPERKRKYTGIRKTMHAVNALVRAGHMADVYWNIKHDEVYCRQHTDGIPRPRFDCTVLATTVSIPVNKITFRQMLDSAITIQGYDNIRFD